jgi:VIT1/CCC1 family predicted Fe2+/Mn2+ transporter
LAEDRRTPDSAADRQQALDDEVEGLARRIAEVVNSAGAEQRQDLREYAIGLLKEETEHTDAPSAPVDGPHAPAPRFNPLAIALLLVLASLPLLLSVVFAPVGLAVLVLAGLMAVWGVLLTVFRRR